MSGSHQHRKLCSITIRESYGKDAETVALHLFRLGRRTLHQIASYTHLRIEKVQLALRGLINYNLVTFTQTSDTVSTLIYSLEINRVMFLERYIRCVPILTSKFNTEGEMLLDTLLKNGSTSASGIILQAASRLLNTQQECSAESALMLMSNKLQLVVKEGFVCRTMAREGPTSREVVPRGITRAEAHLLPTLDMQQLCTKLTNKDLSDKDQKDCNILWTVKMTRITQLHRDEMLARTLVTRVNDHGGNLVRVMLQLMARQDPWAPTSEPIHLPEIRAEVRRNFQHSELDSKLEEYMQVLVDDACKLVKQTVDGEYQVTMKASLEELTWCSIEKIVQEQFGFRGVSIFRVVRLQQYRDQDQIQEAAMIPAKETKQMTYRLMDDNFLQVRELKMPGASGEPGKGSTSYLFHINLQHVARMCLERCYVALYAARMRQDEVTNRCAYLLTKQERVNSFRSLHQIAEDSQELRQIIEEILTPLEQKELDKVKIWKVHLSYAVYELDSSMLMFELFLKIFHKVLDTKDQETPKKEARK